MSTQTADPKTVLLRADELRRQLGEDFRDRIVTSLYSDAERIAERSVHVGARRGWDLDQ